MEPFQGKTHGRRGCRIARRLPLMLHWREPQGAWREIPAETRILSRHGCLLACRARIKLHDEVMVWWLEKMSYARARVVFRSVSPSSDSVEIAFEFLDSEDFWGLNFHDAIRQHCEPDPTVLLR
ncbi:MAG: hypothetical protein LAO06_18620 [Acidobacteriia bacterium]|nr:hypothetical protein [Terriglobia bacterium]